MKVHVLPALGDDGDAREAPERNGSSNKPCHKNAGDTEKTECQLKLEGEH
jgi:hypothetical protein